MKDFFCVRHKKKAVECRPSTRMQSPDKSEQKVRQAVKENRDQQRCGLYQMKITDEGKVFSRETQKSLSARPDALIHIELISLGRMMESVQARHRPTPIQPDHFLQV